MARVILRPDLVLLPLGDDTVLFSEEAQRLVWLTATAAFVVQELKDGKSGDEIVAFLVTEGGVARDDADSWVETTLAGLHSQGMLAGDEGAHDEATTPRFNSLSSSKLEKRYRLLKTVALIRYGMKEQMERVDTVIGHLAIDDDAVPTTTLEIFGSRDEDGPISSGINKNGVPVDVTNGLQRLGPIVKGLLWQDAVNSYDFLFYIHAGVVGLGESCILLPAAAGSGKSSLTAALSHSGFRYFTDEVALITRETFLVPPVPLALCSKSTGWDLMARYYPEISTLQAHERMDGKTIRYLAPPPDAATNAAPVSHIIFPIYEKDGETAIHPLPRVEAVRRLMGECLALRQRLDLGNVKALVQWIAGIECYALTMSSLDEAVELVKQVTTPQEAATSISLD